MVKSMNTKVDLSIKATSFFRITSYGDVLIGDKAFEYLTKRIQMTIFKYLGHKLTILQQALCSKEKLLAVLQYF